MNAALAAKPLPQLSAQYGPMRSVIGAPSTTDVIPEQHDAYLFNIAGGNVLRESVIKGADRKPVLAVRFVEYTDPVTRTQRYAVDFWSIRRISVSDHGNRAMAEVTYERAVRAEYERPTLDLPAERLGKGLSAYYDVTDVA
ncbi:hypothetical protein SAMN05216483_6695 [Streptomyces sp. 2131.1]|uniref:hypothetical protein n=1 Tax=Streptomyces sp. 2131.1 TaxID=1855346 RepID=UPI0008993BEA|nr:hypothetical protein [Streptomyces sp. 2131.1]SEE83117.1 hypothetical protein SAMN05216483_6695 [Streptomyces sp. 2131.1]